MIPVRITDEISCAWTSVDVLFGPNFGPIEAHSGSEIPLNLYDTVLPLFLNESNTLRRRATASKVRYV